MKRMIDYLDLNLLETRAVLQADAPQPPHALLENPVSYSIVMNLLGIDPQDIVIRVNELKREVAVLAKKEARNAKRGFFWVFGVPSETKLGSLTTRYRAGVLEIVIPKYSMNTAA